MVIVSIWTSHDHPQGLESSLMTIFCIFCFQDPDSTIEDIYSVSIDNEERGCREKVHLFETESPSSLETCDFERLVKSVINYADGIVLVFAINSRESFSVIQLLKRAIDKFKEKKEVCPNFHPEIL